MSLTITAVPESLTRAAFLEWIAQIGIDGHHCQQITIDRNGITATVYALDEHGHHYAEQGATEIAMHTIHIRLTDA